MIKINIGLQKQLINFLKDRGISSSTLEAMDKIDRARFIPNALQNKSYENVALPIGEQQTISQPYTVAKMTDLMELKPNDKVLEIGTGSAYQTAILAQLVDIVYSIERIKKLQLQAIRRLNQLEIYNVKLKHSDGWEGWQQNAPYDAIIVTASPNEIPQKLLLQLNNYGRLIIPVEEQGKQVLKRITKVNSQYKVEVFDQVMFVPLIAGDVI